MNKKKLISFLPLCFLFYSSYSSEQQTLVQHYLNFLKDLGWLFISPFSASKNNQRYLTLVRDFAQPGETHRRLLGSLGKFVGCIAQSIL